jgi:hypothetical protein
VKRNVATVVAALLVAASTLLPSAVRAAEPVRQTITPRARIDATALKRLAQLDARGDAAQVRWDFEPNEPEEPLIAPGSTPTFVARNDPAPTKAQSFTYTWSLRRSFRGNRSDLGNPMDPSLAAGPAHLIAMTNVHIVFYTKVGDSLAGATLSAFFQPGSQTPNVFDPRVVYDPGSSRFFAMCLAVGSTPAAAFELAVSNGPDPTLGWTLYEVSNLQDGQGIDYPYIGFGAGAVYLAGNYRSTLFGWPVGSPTHASGVWVIDKAALIAAQPAAVWRFTDVPGESHFPTPEPCTSWSVPPSGLDNFLSSFESVDSNNWRVLVWGVRLPAGWPGAMPTLDRHSYTTPALGAVPNATQLGGPALLQTNNVGSPPSLYTFMNGHIHTALHGPSGSGLFVRHYDINVSGWTSVSGTTEDFWDGSSFHYYPSVAVNPWGDVGLVYSRSSVSEYASALCAIRGQDEVSFQSSQMLKAGERYYGNPPDTPATLYRWGDYSGAAVDPITGGLWFLNLYAGTAPGGGPVQATWIGYVPHAVFVDAGYFFVHTGSRTLPWNQFLDGYNAAWNENDLVLKAGSYHSGSGVLSKPLTITSDGGIATVTP